MHKTVSSNMFEHSKKRKLQSIISSPRNSISQFSNQRLSSLHVSPFNDIGDNGIPNSNEVIFGKQIFQQEDFNSTTSSFFKTFKSCNNIDFVGRVRKIQSPKLRISYSLAFNAVQKDFVESKYDDEQQEIINNVISSHKKQKSIEKDLSQKVRILSKMQERTLKEEFKKSAVTDKINSIQLNLKKHFPSTQKQSVSPTQQYQTPKIVPPQFYLQLLPREIKSNSKPSFVEGTAAVLFSEKFYVYGGLGGSGLKNNLSEYNIKTNLWREIDLKGQFPNEGRTGHSGLYFKGFGVFFGGGALYNRRVKHRECFNTVYLLNLQALTWSKPVPQGDYIFPRRHHKACLYSNKWMFIYGGVDSNENVLGDIALYNIEKNVWKLIEGVQEEPIAWHSVVNVSEYLKFNSQSQEKDQLMKKETYPTDLIYCFGGKESSGEATNRIKKLQYHPITDLPNRWETLIALGTAPRGCYNQTMEYYHRLYCLIVIGGRLDDLNVSYVHWQFQGQLCSAIDQIYLFMIKYNTWVEVVVRGAKQARCAHISQLYGENKLILFGGIGNDKYLEGDISLIEMDQTQVYHKILQEKRQEKQKEIEKTSNTLAKDIPQQESKARKIDLWDQILPVQKKSTIQDRFRKWQSNQNTIRSFLPVPQMNQPKIRYDLFQGFLKQFLLQHQEAIHSIFNQQQAATNEELKGDKKKKAFSKKTIAFD